MQNADNHNFHKQDNSLAPGISSSFILKPVINPASTIFQTPLCLHREQSLFSQLIKTILQAPYLRPSTFYLRFVPSCPG